MNKLHKKKLFYWKKYHLACQVLLSLLSDMLWTDFSSLILLTRESVWDVGHWMLVKVIHRIKSRFSASEVAYLFYYSTPSCWAGSTFHGFCDFQQVAFMHLSSLLLQPCKLFTPAISHTPPCHFSWTSVFLQHLNFARTLWTTAGTEKYLLSGLLY